LAKGLGSESIITSPTFTVSRIYKCRDGLSLHHYDFYRLHEGGMVGRELDEVMQDTKAVVAVEWGDVVSDVIPAEHIEVSIERSIKGEDIRKITANYPDKFNYIFEAIV